MKKILLMGLLLTVFAVCAKEKTEISPYLEGVQYTNIEPAYPTNNDKQVVLYEFFSYRCPHCAHFQPYMKDLLKDLPSYVKLIQVPLGFNPSWKVFAQAYYTAQSMGILEKSHQAIFDALHKQHKPLRSIEDVAAWYASEFGIDRDKFLSIANSFMVDSMIKKGDDIAIAMKVPNTPKLVVNGKYMPEIMGLKSNEAVIEATRYFIKQEAKRMGLVE